MKKYHGYKISKGYRKLTIFTFSKFTNSLVCTEWFSPDKERPRKEKYKLISEILWKDFNITAPCYKETGAENKERLAITQQAQ